MGKKNSSRENMRTTKHVSPGPVLGYGTIESRGQKRGSNECLCLECCRDFTYNYIYCHSQASTCDSHGKGKFISVQAMETLRVTRS
jgi:hypothetical protein